MTFAHDLVVIDAIRSGSLAKECPSIASFIYDVIVIIEDGDRELVAAQIFPNVFDWIELGRVWRQTDESDVSWDSEVVGAVVAGAIEEENGVRARSDVTAYFGEMAKFMASVLAVGRTRAAAARRCGQTAPKI